MSASKLAEQRFVNDMMRITKRVFAKMTQAERENRLNELKAYLDSLAISGEHGGGLMSKLAEQLMDQFECHYANVPQALDEMALRVFEDTRERAAKQVTPYRSANAIRRAIRAMQPDGK